MESSINTKSGGSAAQTTNTNPNPNPNPNPQHENQMNQNHMATHNQKTPHQDDIPVPLKQNAKQFDCFVGTLKNNVKNGNLPALQVSPKAPYLVKPSDVEKLLRNTPGIASIFHPQGSQTPDTGMTRTPEPKHAVPPIKDQVGVAHAQPGVTGANSEAASTLDASAHTPVHAQTTTQAPAVTLSTASIQTQDYPGDIPPPEPQGRILKPTPVEAKAPVDQPVLPAGQQGSDSTCEGPPRKRRRRRRGQSVAKQENHNATDPFSKVLQGTTLTERLKITACLNVFASMVASA